ncbi:HD domain-containing phosphohydrolase [Oscillospiraceae bacterium PP1C4]
MEVEWHPVMMAETEPDRLCALVSLLKDFCKNSTDVNAEKILKFIRMFSPDLELPDAAQPAAKGMDNCKRIRSLALFSDLPTHKKGNVPRLPCCLYETLVLQDVCIQAMASLAEISYDETGNHIMRTQYYVKALAKRLAERGLYHDVLTSENIMLIAKSALVHDIGKIGIPKYILLKPGILTQQEFEIMKTHTTLGLNAIKAAAKMSDISASYLRITKEIVYSHHERWDGTGYPLGLSGEQIPVSARLMALADVYDALTSKRVYKDAYSHEVAAGMIRKNAGTHFDPRVVETFEALESTFKEISECYVST